MMSSNSYVAKLELEIMAGGPISTVHSRRGSNEHKNKSGIELDHRGLVLVLDPF